MGVVELSAAAFGSAFQEFLHWYGARRRLGHPAHRRLVKSVEYSLMVVVMIAGSALGTALWFYGEPQHPRTYMLVGAAFPLLFKKAAGAYVSEQETLGPARDKSAIHNYLRSA